jgi:ornithine cyclodeaminase/alanine dehydrogenase-like protein (mu-crystallin family)
MNRGTLLLTRTDVGALLGMQECIDAVEAAFRRHAEGKIPPPGILGMHVPGGGFHVKAASLPGARSYFAAKTNANFPGNPSHGLPTIQGAILLFDAIDGVLLSAVAAVRGLRRVLVSDTDHGRAVRFAEQHAKALGIPIEAIGDLHHAIDAGTITRSGIHAELGEIVAGRKPGRQSETETILFDSSGVALGDVAAAALVYERAVDRHRGASIRMVD